MTTDYAHALFIDLDNAVHKVDSLVDGIYAVQECAKPPANRLSPWLCAYECTLRTKYYTADVRLCTVDHCQHVDSVTPTYAASIGARTSARHAHTINSESLVLNFNGASLNEHPAARLVDVLQPSMGLLVCDRVSDACRERVHAFCIEHHFELIELNPDQEHIDEADECAEKWGIARVVQALQSHTWPNAELFNDTNTHKSTAALIASSQTCSSAARVDDRLFESESHEQILKAIAASADESASFEELFDKFAHMKVHAQTIQDDDERKRFAEKVLSARVRKLTVQLAIQFMAAMGCDDGSDEQDDSDLSNVSADELDDAHKLVEQDK